MKTLKWAILQLPKIDKRWVSHPGFKHSIHEHKIYHWDRLSIDELHAAAKAIGYEIGWVTKYVPLLGFVYYSYYINANKDEHMETLYCKFPAIAIRAAFIAAVEHKLKELQ
jgi:hypothetical protein